VIRIISHCRAGPSDRTAPRIARTRDFAVSCTGLASSLPQRRLNASARLTEPHDRPGPKNSRALFLQIGIDGNFCRFVM
jgi:hypothetical protein